MTNCGRSDAFCPANSSAETTLSSEKSATDCAAAGCITTTEKTAKIAEIAKKGFALRSSRSPRFFLLDTLEHHVARVRRDPGQRGHQRADDFGVELGAGAAPQLAQCVAGRTRAAVRAGAGHRVVGVGHVHDARGERDVVAAQPGRVAAAVGPL